MTDNMSGRLVIRVMGVITPSVDIQCWHRVAMLRMGLTACGSSAPPSRSTTVNLVVNGAYSVNKPAGQYSGTSTFNIPFILRSYKLQVYVY